MNIQPVHLQKQMAPRQQDLEHSDDEVQTRKQLFDFDAFSVQMCF